MQAEDERGEHPTNVIVRVGDKYFVSVALLEYDEKKAQTDDQKKGVKAVRDSYKSLGTTQGAEVAFVAPKPGVPRPLNTGFL